MFRATLCKDLAKIQISGGNAAWTKNKFTFSTFGAKGKISWSAPNTTKDVGLSRSFFTSSEFKSMKIVNRPMNLKKERNLKLSLVIPKGVLNCRGFASNPDPSKEDWKVVVYRYTDYARTQTSQNPGLRIAVVFVSSAILAYGILYYLPGVALGMVGLAVAFFGSSVALILALSGFGFLSFLWLFSFLLVLWNIFSPPAPSRIFGPPNTLLVLEDEAMSQLSKDEKVQEIFGTPVSRSPGLHQYQTIRTPFEENPRHIGLFVKAEFIAEGPKGRGIVQTVLKRTEKGFLVHEWETIHLSITNIDPNQPISVVLIDKGVHETKTIVPEITRIPTLPGDSIPGQTPKAEPTL